MTSTGHRTASQTAATVPGCPRDRAARSRRIIVSAPAPIDQSTQSSTLLRGVRLGEHLAEEELREVRPVLQPVVAVLLLPALVRVARRVEVERDPVRQRRGQPQPGIDRADPEHPLGRLGRP